MMNKSSFAQTCNRLSQFMKERRSLGDFSSFQNMSSSMLDINGTKEMSGGPTMNLFPKKNMEEEKNQGENLKSLVLFPLSSSSDDTDESTKNMADERELPVSKEEPKTTGAKMTIFYGGQVIIFDDLPEDKAQEIMSFARQVGTIGSRPEAPAPAVRPTQGTVLQEPASLSDLPIARRVSLHRFMEKRKDRIASASPYPLQRSMSQSHREKYDLMRQLRQKQQELELKLF